MTRDIKGGVWCRVYLSIVTWPGLWLLFCCCLVEIRELKCVSLAGQRSAWIRLSLLSSPPVSVVWSQSPCTPVVPVQLLLSGNQLCSPENLGNCLIFHCDCWLLFNNSLFDVSLNWAGTWDRWWRCCQCLIVVMVVIKFRLLLFYTNLEPLLPI